MRQVLQFVLTFAGLAFSLATILAIYEGSKPNAYQALRENEGRILWFSVVAALVLTVVAFGLTGSVNTGFGE